MTAGLSGEMPFLDHLEELRHRLFWSLGALVVCMMIAFTVVLQTDVIGVLAEPVLRYLPSGKLIFTHPADVITISLKVAFGVGLLGAAPVIGYHVWRFLSPALHPHEKRLMIPVLLSATVLFCAGVYIGWRWVLPVMLDVLFGIQSASLQPMITATDYFSFMVTTCLAFGAASQTPIVVFALTALGIVTPKGMSKFRRHAMVGSVIVSAVVTPGDLIVMTALLALPLYGLYEVSIIVSAFTFRARQRRLRKAESRVGEASA